MSKQGMRKQWNGDKVVDVAESVKGGEGVKEVVEEKDDSSEKKGMSIKVDFRGLLGVLGTILCYGAQAVICVLILVVIWTLGLNFAVMATLAMIEQDVVTSFDAQMLCSSVAAGAACGGLVLVPFEWRAMNKWRAWVVKSARNNFGKKTTEEG